MHATVRGWRGCQGGRRRCVDAGAARGQATMRGRWRGCQGAGDDVAWTLALRGGRHRRASEPHKVPPWRRCCHLSAARPVRPPAWPRPRARPAQGSCSCTGPCTHQPTQVCRQLQVYRSLHTPANPGVQAAAGVQVSADGSQPRCAGSCRCTGLCGRQPTQACRQLQVYRSLRTAANPGMQAAAWPDLRGDCCGAHLQLAWLASMSAPSSASFWAGALSLSHTALNACTLQPAASRRRAV
jgi:hypothetical protein